MVEPNETLKIEPTTAAITIVSIVVGALLVHFGHESIGAALLTFATGAAAVKPILRRGGDS